MTDDRRPPKTVREIAIQLWYAVYGANGTDGIVNNLNEHLKWHKSQGRNRWVIAKDVVLILVSLGSLLVASVVMGRGK